MERKKILIVDDEISITNMLKEALNNMYEVRSENNGLVALKVAQEFSPDLIILDIEFPNTSGGEIASQIETNHKLKDTPIIFLTGILKKEEERTIAGHPFLAKPVNIVELFENIDSNLKKDSP